MVLNITCFDYSRLFLEFSEINPAEILVTNMVIFVKVRMVSVIKEFKISLK